MIAIDVKWNINNGDVTFVIKGHAGYAPKGYDIICASVSTLAQYLEFYSMHREHNNHDKIEKIEGDMIITFTDLQEEEMPPINAAIEFFKALVKQYPKYIKANE